MIKYLVTSLIIFAFNPAIVNILFSQTFEFGIKSGINTSYFQGDQYSFIADDVQLSLDPKVAIRFTGGAIARINFTPAFAMQTEILYTTKGARFNEEIDVRGQELNIEGGITLGYMEVPLLLRFSTTRRDRGPLFYPKPGMTFNAYAGGVAAYRTRSTFRGEITGDLFGLPFDEEFKNNVWYQFDDIDYGIVVGTGFEYGADDTMKYLVDVRYTLGLMDIGDDTQTHFSLRNGNISLSVGLVF